jgi:thioredoxin-like negative regulator of GroEL
MSGLLFLTTDDFQLNQGIKGNIMCNSIQGFSLILFYSTQCQHCQSLIPIFKTLPGSVGGCQFGMINVSINKTCVLMSRQSIAPIKVVPYIILYVNGKPYMRYQGPHDAREIARFIVEVSQEIQSKKVYTKEDKHIKIDKKGGIPAYTIGNPLCGTDGNCTYLEFDIAYGNNKINE